MPWLQCAVEVGAEEVETVEDLLLAAGAHSVSLEDAAGEPLLEPEPGTTPLWSRVRVIALFAADADRDRIADMLARDADSVHGPVFEPLADREWSRAWLDHCQPLAFGQRLHVIPEGHPLPAEGGIVLRLDPGLAFGTGSHPTTALCLEWLDAVAPVERTVLDYGCGSGILAIAAALLGAHSVTGVDIDPQALEATRANAASNGVADTIRAMDVVSFQGVEQPPSFDVIVANILARPLIDVAEALAARQPAGGRLALAGLLDRQAGEVIAAYEAHYRMDVSAEREGWVLVTGERR